MSTFLLNNLPRRRDAEAYVHVVRSGAGLFCVEAFDRADDGYMKRVARWQAQPKGRAFLLARLVSTRGYEWRRA